MIITCPSCELARIQGLICHETGCPNANTRWIDGEWVRVYECTECGTEHLDPNDLAKCCGAGYDVACDERAYGEPWHPEYGHCILTGAAGELPEDHLTHAHESL